MRHLRHVLIAFDQLVNALTGGWPDETLSSRIHREAVLVVRPKYRWLLARRLANGLFFWQADHCRGSYGKERERSHLPPELRNPDGKTGH